MPARKLLKRTEYFIPRANIEAITLEREGIEVYTMATLRKCFVFSAGEQAGAQALAPLRGSNPEDQHVEPAPVNLTKDAANKCSLGISCDDAEALGFPVAGTLNVGLK